MRGRRLHYTNRVLDVVVDGFGVDVGLVDLDDAPVGEHAWPHGWPVRMNDFNLRNIATELTVEGTPAHIPRSRSSASCRAWCPALEALKPAYCRSIKSS